MNNFSIPGLSAADLQQAYESRSNGDNPSQMSNYGRTWRFANENPAPTVAMEETPEAAKPIYPPHMMTTPEEISAPIFEEDFTEEMEVSIKEMQFSKKELDAMTLEDLKTIASAMGILDLTKDKKGLTKSILETGGEI